MTTKQMLTELLAFREQLPNEDDPCRVFVDDMIWSVREAMAWEQYGHPVTDRWKQLGLRTGDSTAFSLTNKLHILTKRRNTNEREGQATGKTKPSGYHVRKEALLDGALWLPAMRQ